VLLREAGVELPHALVEVDPGLAVLRPAALPVRAVAPLPGPDHALVVLDLEEHRVVEAEELLGVDVRVP
jgi:hypothetical protein